MKEKLFKQAGVCLLIILAIFISQNSGIGLLERGSAAVMKYAAVNYTAGDIKKAGEKFAESAAAFPEKAESVINIIAGKSLYAEPIDEIYKDGKAMVYAVAAGQVCAVGENEEIGKYIKIIHGGDGESLYGNLDEIYIKVPSKVKKGQIIGMFKNSGNKEFYYSFKEFN